MGQNEIVAIARRLFTRVRQLAHCIARHLPASVDVDDLIQAGLTGLIGALRAYDPQRSASVDAYATFRARGAMLDSLRDLDPLSRLQRRGVRAVEQARHDLSGRLGREPDERELAERCQISPEQLGAVRGQQQAAFARSIDDETLGVAGAGDPEDELARRRQQVALLAAVRRLPERQQTVVALRYGKDLALREIGQLLGVTESRACQIHQEAIATLRTLID